MDSERIERTTAAWVAAWQRGNAHPAVVAAALRALAQQAAADPAARAVVARGQRRLAEVPYASVWALADE